VLWLLISVSTAGFFVLIVKNTPVWFSLTAGLALIWIGFVWIPRSSVNVISRSIAVFLAPGYAKLLSYLYPVFKHSEKRVDSLRHNRHTGLYEKSDIVELLHAQLKQLDNRVEATEIDLLIHALSFNDKYVGDIMVPRKKVIAVSSEDKIGPIVLSELHKSGCDYFPVYKVKKYDIVGILKLETDYGSADGRKIDAVMDGKTIFIHEDQPLSQALSVIIRSHKPLLIVINEFEEYVGIVSSKDILKELIGEMIIDDLTIYEDKRAVSQIFSHPPDNKIEKSEDTDSEELIE
jgi:CBS domain containing-hemolysin-like protein